MMKRTGYQHYYLQHGNWYTIQSSRSVSSLTANYLSTNGNTFLLTINEVQKGERYYKEAITTDGYYNNNWCSKAYKLLFTSEQIEFIFTKQSQREMKNKEISDYNDKIDNPPPPYTKQELDELLKRHSAQIINPSECGCQCPFTGNSIQILIKFVGAHNDINTKIIDKAVKVAAKLSKNQCIIGDRKITAAAILHYTSIMMGMNMIQRTVAELFYVTDVSIRKRRRQLFGDPKSNISNKRRKES